MHTHHPIDRGSTSWAQTLGWLGLRIAICAAAVAVALAFTTFEPEEHGRMAMQAHPGAHR
jgi:hypothetical protein